MRRDNKTPLKKIGFIPLVLLENRSIANKVTRRGTYVHIIISTETFFIFDGGNISTEASGYNAAFSTMPKHHSIQNHNSVCFSRQMRNTTKCFFDCTLY